MNEGPILNQNYQSNLKLYVTSVVSSLKKGQGIHDKGQVLMVDLAGCALIKICKF
jgi:hypothetical protein